MVAGGLEMTAQENRATEPTITTTGTGCNTNSEIPVKKIKQSISTNSFVLVPDGNNAFLLVKYTLCMQCPDFDEW